MINTPKDPRYEEYYTDKRCVVCKDFNIIEQKTKVYVPESGPPIIGPGSKAQFYTKVTYYCGNCGIQYYKLPHK